MYANFLMRGVIPNPLSNILILQIFLHGSVQKDAPQKGD